MTFKTKSVLTIVIYIFCAIGLFFVGRISATAKIFNSNVKYSLPENYELSEWEILEMAIAKTESEFNEFAVGSRNDHGIFQITPIYVEEVNRILGERKYSTSDAFSIEKSIEMFNIIQNYHNHNHDIDKAMHQHNPGGKSVNYFNRVYNNIVFIKRMEKVRKEIIMNKSYLQSEDKGEIDSAVVNEIKIDSIKVKKAK